jgi:hypothetical protein
MPSKMVRIEGVATALEALSGKNVGIAKREVKKRAYGIARVARDRLRTASPEGETGNLKRAHKAKTSRGGGATVYVDRSGGRSGKGYHYHIVAKGTGSRKTRKGANRGVMPSNNYADPILDATIASASAELSREVLDELVKNIKGGL